jgi:Fur family ferric uptake transcriptional regulator
MNRLLEKENIAEVLGSHQLRATNIRIAVFEIFQKTEFALNHREIKEKLKQSVDRVTLFRTLNSFIEKNIIHKITDDDGGARYALCDLDKCTIDGHNDIHVHFKCQVCGKIFCVRTNKYYYPELPRSFKVTEWKLTAKGICSSCAKGETERKIAES